MPSDTIHTRYLPEPPGSGTGPPVPRRSIMVLLVPLMLVLFISTLDQTIVATALGGIGKALGDSHNVAWVATSYLLTSAVTTLIFGKLGDMYGRKRVFQLSVALFVLGSLLCALAPSMLWLILLRGLQGIGGGGLNSLVQAIVADLVPARQRPRYQAVLGIVPALGIILGPLLGGFFVDVLSWHWIFLINVPVGLVAFAIIAARLRLPARTGNRRIDVAGGLLAMAFTTALLLATVWGGQTYAWSSAPIVALLAASAFALLAYLLVEHRAAEPITPLHLFANGIFSVSSALFLLSTAALFVAMLFTPLMLQNVFGYSAFTAGLCLIPLLIGLIAATAASGGAITRTGRYRIYPILGSFLTGGGLYALSTVGARTPLWLVLGWTTLVGVGIGLFIQVALLAGQNAVDSRFLGVATGALNFFKTIGGALGAALFGAILAGNLPATGTPSPAQAVTAFQVVFRWSVPVMALALIFSLLLREKPLSEEMVEVAQGHVDVPEY